MADGLESYMTTMCLSKVCHSEFWTANNLSRDDMFTVMEWVIRRAEESDTVKDGILAKMVKHVGPLTVVSTLLHRTPSSVKTLDARMRDICVTLILNTKVLMDIVSSPSTPYAPYHEIIHTLQWMARHDHIALIHKALDVWKGHHSIPNADIDLAEMDAIVRLVLESTKSRDTGLALAKFVLFRAPTPASVDDRFPMLQRIIRATPKTSISTVARFLCPDANDPKIWRAVKLLVNAGATYGVPSKTKNEHLMYLLSLKRDSDGAEYIPTYLLKALIQNRVNSSFIKEIVRECMSRGIGIPEVPYDFFNGRDTLFIDQILDIAQAAQDQLTMPQVLALQKAIVFVAWYKAARNKIDALALRCGATFVGTSHASFQPVLVFV